MTSGDRGSELSAESREGSEERKTVRPLLPQHSGTTRAALTLKCWGLCVREGKTSCLKFTFLIVSFKCSTCTTSVTKTTTKSRSLCKWQTSSNPLGQGILPILTQTQGLRLGLESHSSLLGAVALGDCSLLTSARLEEQANGSLTLSPTTPWQPSIADDLQLSLEAPLTLWTSVSEESGLMLPFRG